MVTSSVPAYDRRENDCDIDGHITAEQPCRRRCAMSEQERQEESCEQHREEDLAGNAKPKQVGLRSAVENATEGLKYASSQSMDCAIGVPRCEGQRDECCKVHSSG